MLGRTLVWSAAVAVVAYVLERDLQLAIITGAVGGPALVLLVRLKDSVRARLVRRHGDRDAVREELERGDLFLERVLFWAALAVFILGFGIVQRSSALVLFGLGGIAFAALCVAYVDGRLRRAAKRD